MSQVLRNFLSNAIKFTPEGGRVTVRVNKIHNDLSVEVEDTGAGISPTDICKLFHEVVQFNANALQGGGGTGLGLWISKKIIDLHGGTIGVRSGGEGLGSTFYFTIPILPRETEGSQGHADRPASRPSSSRAESLRQRMLVEMKQYSGASRDVHIIHSFERNCEISSESRSKENSFQKRVSAMLSYRSTMKIIPESNVMVSVDGDAAYQRFSALSFLVVDDSAMIRKYVCAKLMKEGCRVNECEDGDKAVEFIQNVLQDPTTSCDIVIIDNVRFNFL